MPRSYRKLFDCLRKIFLELMVRREGTIGGDADSWVGEIEGSTFRKPGGVSTVASLTSAAEQGGGGSLVVLNSPFLHNEGNLFSFIFYVT